MVVLRQSISVFIAIGHPPIGPFFQPRTGLLFLLRGELKAPLTHFAKRPTMDWRLAKIPHHISVVRAVGQCTKWVLEVKHHGPLIPSQIRLGGHKGNCVETMIPAPNIRHPVLAHQHRLTTKMPPWRNESRPENVGRKLARLFIAGSKFGKAAQPFHKFRPNPFLSGFDGNRNPGRLPCGVKILDFQFPRTVITRLDFELDLLAHIPQPGGGNATMALQAGEHELRSLCHEIGLPAVLTGDPQRGVTNRFRLQTQPHTMPSQTQAVRRDKNSFHRSRRGMDFQSRGCEILFALQCLAFGDQLHSKNLTPTRDGSPHRSKVDSGVLAQRLRPRRIDTSHSQPRPAHAEGNERKIVFHEWKPSGQSCNCFRFDPQSYITKMS